MLTVTRESEERFLFGLAAWEARTQKRITEVYRGLAISLYNFAVFETPQWSGSAASNWNIRYGYPSTQVDLSLKESNASERGALSSGRNQPRLKFGVPVAQKGDARAVAVAAGRNQDSVATIRSHLLPIFITNATTDLNGVGYAQLLEENPNNYLRSVNDPGHMVARGTAKAYARFARLSPSDEFQLRSLTLGSPTNAGLR